MRGACTPPQNIIDSAVAFTSWAPAYCKAEECVKRCNTCRHLVHSCMWYLRAHPGGTTCAQEPGMVPRCIVWESALQRCTMPAGPGRAVPPQVRAAEVAPRLCAPGWLCGCAPAACNRHDFCCNFASLASLPKPLSDRLYMLCPVTDHVASPVALESHPSLHSKCSLPATMMQLLHQV